MLLRLVNGGGKRSHGTHCGVVQVHPRGPRAVVLHERPDEAQPERPLKQELCLPLVLGQTEEGHISQVLLG